jgi:hypothetical protein
VLVSILVTLTSRIYKGGQGPSQNKIIRSSYTQRNTNHHTGRRVLRTSRPEPVYILCSLHLQVPDLGVSSPKFTTLGIPLGGQPVKHRQLARQVGECIEDPPANSMASFRFTRSVPSQGTTFVFGSWVCIADGASNFRQFLVDMKPKTSAAGPCSNLDKFIDNLDDLSIHASTAKIEMESASGVTSSSVATTRFQSKDSRN